MTGIDGRRVLVTGASSGIGAATARACASAGARVACLARRTERVDALAAEIDGVPVTADIADETAARQGVEEAVAALGGLDAVVNNAGAMVLDHVSEGRARDWRTMLEVNVLGTLSVTHAAVPHLRAAGRGDVVMMSSMSGRRVPNAAAGVYAATKHAVHALSDGLRRELHGENIRVAVIAPGVVNTGFGAGDSEANRRVQQLQEDIGLTPDDVARQVVWVLGEPPHVTVHEIALLPTAQG